MLKKERKGLEEKKARSPPHSKNLKKSRTHRYFLLVKVGVEVQAVADGVQDWAEEVKYVRLNAHNVSKTTSASKYGSGMVDGGGEEDRSHPTAGHHCPGDWGTTYGILFTFEREQAKLSHGVHKAPSRISI